MNDVYCGLGNSINNDRFWSYRSSNTAQLLTDPIRRTQEQKLAGRIRRVLNLRATVLGEFRIP